MEDSLNQYLRENAKKDANLREAMTSNDLDDAWFIVDAIRNLHDRIDIDEEEALWNLYVKTFNEQVQ